MKAILLLSIISLSSCGLVHIEFREKTPQKREKSAGREEQTREKGPVWEPLSVKPPVKGRPIKLRRGYFIETSCDDFFRSINQGKVLYSGDDIKSYSWLVIIEQVDGYVAVYGKANRIFVKKGERVKKEQVLGKVGREGERCGIFFDIRNKDGMPVSFEFER
ncbi:MAG: peptidoglycan DD-metalloendopeptidase family protein [Aquificaceae bacterium]